MPLSFVQSVGQPWMWTTFLILISMMIMLDLGVLGSKESRHKTFAQALRWTVFWVGLAACFSVWIYTEFGSTKAVEFVTGYIIEESLSVDNLFVFLVIFSFFRVPEEFQHRVLFFGILGAIVMRGIFILLGAALVQRFHFVMYIFGVLLIVTAYKLLRQKEEQFKPDQDPVYRLVRRVIPAVADFRGDKFFVREDRKIKATPLLFVLIAIEVADLVFAIDSIPAVFAVTADPFIVFTSNIFAILGLRSLYFLVSAALRELAYLKVGLSIVLAFVGMKILLAHVYPIPSLVSLLVVATIIGIAVLLSLRKERRERGLKEG